MTTRQKETMSPIQAVVLGAEACDVLTEGFTGPPERWPAWAAEYKAAAATLRLIHKANSPLPEPTPPRGCPMDAFFKPKGTK